MEFDNVSVNDLDRIRQKKGIDACKESFQKTEKEHRQNAVKLLNAGNLRFTTLFILRPQIRKSNLERELSERNRIALWICKKIFNKKNKDIFSLDIKKIRFVMLWMFDTGAEDDGLCNEFDEILDICASVLIKKYHEKNILPVIADMIFKRNQKDLYNHDLIWAFFQSRDIPSLQLIVNRLKSSVLQDVELSRKLLHLQKDTNRDPQKQYAEYSSWLKENAPYLYFTGESFQLTDSPVPCDVNLQAKYLCKNSFPNKCRLMTPLSDIESTGAEEFNKAREIEKIFLAKCSQKLHKEDKLYWKQWMQYPVSKQIQIARYGRRDYI